MQVVTCGSYQADRIEFIPGGAQNARHPDLRKDRLAFFLDERRQKKSQQNINRHQKNSHEKLTKRLINGESGGVNSRQEKKRPPQNSQAEQESLQKKSLKRERKDESNSLIDTKRPRGEDIRLDFTKASNTTSGTKPDDYSSCSPRSKHDRHNSDKRARSLSLPSHFLIQGTGGKVGYVLGPEFSPLTKAGIKAAVGFSPLKQIFEEGSQASTPNGTVLGRSAKTDVGSTYTLKATPPDRCTYNKTKARSDITPSYAPLEELEGFIILDESRLDEFFGVRKGWSTTQGKVMRISAEEAAINAGVEVRGEFHWLHLFAFSMGGKNGVEPNEEQNLILGTAGSNGFHLRMEDVIKGLVRKYGQIYVRYSIDPNQTEFDAKWHLCGKFSYEFGRVKPELVEAYRLGNVLEDQVKGKFLNSISIDTLDTRFPSFTDYTFFSAFAETAYERSVAKENAGVDYSSAKMKLGYDNQVFEI